MSVFWKITKSGVLNLGTLQTVNKNSSAEPNLEKLRLTQHNHDCWNILLLPIYRHWHHKCYIIRWQAKKMTKPVTGKVSYKVTLCTLAKSIYPSPLQIRSLTPKKPFPISFFICFGLVSVICVIQMLLVHILCILISIVRNCSYLWVYTYYTY